MRHLHQDSGAVASERIAATGAAVGEVFEHLEPLTNDRVALGAVHVDDKSHAAGIVLVGGIVEALLGWQTGLGRWQTRAGVIGEARHGGARACCVGNGCVKDSQINLPDQAWAAPVTGTA